MSLHHTPGWRKRLRERETAPPPQSVEEYIRLHGVTRCPTAYAAASEHATYRAPPLPEPVENEKSFYFGGRRWLIFEP